MDKLLIGTLAAFAFVVGSMGLVWLTRRRAATFIDARRRR